MPLCADACQTAKGDIPKHTDVPNFLPLRHGVKPRGLERLTSTVTTSLKSALWTDFLILVYVGQNTRSVALNCKYIVTCKTL